MKPFEITDPASLKLAVLEILNQQRSVYASFLDKVPEPFKTDLAKLKETIDAKLIQFQDQPTTMVPAAQAAAGGLEQAAWMLTYLQESYSNIIKGLQTSMEALVPKAQALHSFETRLSAGELIEKEKAEQATKEAVDRAVKTEREHQLLISTRRQSLQTAGLPIAEDAILEGDDQAFTALSAKAKERLTKLEPVRQQLDAQELATLAYAPDADTQISRLLKVAKLGEGRTTADPLVGGPGAAKVSIGF